MESTIQLMCVCVLCFDFESRKGCWRMSPHKGSDWISYVSITCSLQKNKGNWHKTWKAKLFEKTKQHWEQIYLRRFLTSSRSESSFGLWSSPPPTGVCRPLWSQTPGRVRKEFSGVSGRDPRSLWRGRPGVSKESQKSDSFQIFRFFWDFGVHSLVTLAWHPALGDSCRTPFQLPGLKGPADPCVRWGGSEGLGCVSRAWFCVVFYVQWLQRFASEFSDSLRQLQFYFICISFPDLIVRWGYDGF